MIDSKYNTKETAWRKLLLEVETQQSIELQSIIARKSKEEFISTKIQLN
jgi:hypothetical protein